MFMNSNDNIKLFKEVEEDFGIDVAIGVLQIYTITTTIKPTVNHISGKKSFEKKVEKKCKKILYSMPPGVFDICWEIVEVLPTWYVGQSLFGLGGSMEMRVKDLLKGPKKLNSLKI